MNTIVNIILAIFVAYMIINIMFLSKRNSKNRRLLTLFDNFDNESVFFKVCDEYLNSIKDKPLHIIYTKIMWEVYFLWIMK